MDMGDMVEYGNVRQGLD